MKNEFSSWK